MNGLHTNEDLDDNGMVRREPVKKRRGRKPKAEREATPTGDPEGAYKDAVSAFLKARRQLAKWTSKYHDADVAMRAAEGVLKGKKAK